MNQPDQHLEDIKVIKKIMEESSRFLSLSGLSGIIAGLLAIAGAVVANLIITGTAGGRRVVLGTIRWRGCRDQDHHSASDRHGSCACAFASRCSDLFQSQSKAERSQRMDTRHPQDAGKPSPSAGNGRSLHSHNTQQGPGQV